MQSQIVEGRALPNTRPWVRFADDAGATVDLSSLLGRGVFANWKDPAFFAQVSIDLDSQTVCWPGGIDLDPYVLHSHAAGKPLPGSEPFRAAP